jgi:hypothetical protein
MKRTKGTPRHASTYRGAIRNSSTRWHEARAARRERWKQLGLKK